MKIIENKYRHKKIKLYKEDCCATGPVVAQGHKLVTVRVNATG